jgi:hypothetical protein
MQLSDEAITKIGAMLEDLSARFELVIEGVSGFGGRLDQLRGEIIGQFAEVGGQMRFLSEQIAENRRGIAVVRDDLGKELIRLGETLGRLRAEFREELLAIQAAAPATGRAGKLVATPRQETGSETAETARGLRREVTGAVELAAKKLSAELIQTNKSLVNLARKFDRFDDRITVQTHEQDQRLRKLERKARA